jgi:hypothetical protein
MNLVTHSIDSLDTLVDLFEGLVAASSLGHLSTIGIASFGDWPDGVSGHIT